MCPTAGSMSPPALKRSNCSRSVSSIPQQLPVVLFADGTVLVDPEPDALAGRVGLQRSGRPGFLRPGGRGRRSRGPGRRGLWRQRGPQYRGHRAGSARADRPAPAPGSKTTSAFPSGVTGAELGRRAHTQAVALRRRICHPARRRAAHRWAIPVYAACRWPRSLQPRRDPGPGRAIPQARHPRLRTGLPAAASTTARRWLRPLPARAKRSIS